MLTINCTGKLRKEIDYEIKETSQENRDDFYNWHAHLVTIQRRKAVILMNVATRYSIILYGLKKADFKNLSELITNAIKDNLKAEGIKKFYIDEYMKRIEDINYSKTYSRSILSSINYLKKFIDHGNYELASKSNQDMIELNKENNRIPILQLETAYPIEELRAVFKARMGKSYDKVYRFKISLKGIKPTIWRKIEVPEDYTFWDLHVAIQDAMGWFDYHLHEFKAKVPEGKLQIGIPDQEFGDDVATSWQVKIADYFTEENKTVNYIYDFGDYWQHIIELEEIKPAKKEVDYPICVEGERACPPEDCGGIPGYQRILEILNNPEDEEYERIIEWLEEGYDPDYFDPSAVKFDNPQKRLQKLS